ncbi:MAG: hypothetical protein AABW65_01355, partial [Nanoarchaeota archaeon]
IIPNLPGRGVLGFSIFGASKREGLGHKTRKESLSVVIVLPANERVGKWRGSFLLYPELKKDESGVVAPEVYVSGSGKTNDAVVLYIHDDLDFMKGLPVYTNIGGAFAYRDYSWTNSPVRGYSARSFPFSDVVPVLEQ